jgi:hypothetical protein
MNRGAFWWLAEQPGDQTTDERTGNAEDACHQDTHGLSAGHDPSRYRTDNDADDEHPKVMKHVVRPEIVAECAQHRGAARNTALALRFTLRQSDRSRDSELTSASRLSSAIDVRESASGGAPQQNRRRQLKVTAPPSIGGASHARMVSSGYRRSARIQRRARLENEPLELLEVVRQLIRLALLRAAGSSACSWSLLVLRERLGPLLPS